MFSFAFSFCFSSVGSAGGRDAAFLEEEGVEASERASFAEESGLPAVRCVSRCASWGPRTLVAFSALIAARTDDADRGWE